MKRRQTYAEGKRAAVFAEKSTPEARSVAAARHRRKPHLQQAFGIADGKEYHQRTLVATSALSI